MDSDSSDDLRLAIDDEEDSSDFESETISAFGKICQLYHNGLKYLYTLDSWTTGKFGEINKLISWNIILEVASF